MKGCPDLVGRILQMYSGKSFANVVNDDIIIDMFRVCARGETRKQLMGTLDN